MKPDIAISIQNVSKCFKQYNHPGDRLKELLFKKRSSGQEYWALREIDLEIFRGETLGIVGRNGSGKSTLLQIIAGTLTASSGTVKVNGRVSALLELGSGFNPEFTGRQNIFFNAMLLGLTRTEIKAKFDQIINFASIGKFLDRPVKTYSSGMFVRLAFAVAINLDPDILIIDEALAVGDEAFQRKCFAQIKEIQAQGKTILFVSHSGATVVDLCTKAILIDAGEILLSGLPKQVVAQYQKLIYAPPEKVDKIRQSIRLNLNTASNNLANVLSSNVVYSQTLDKSQAFYDPNLKPQSTVYYATRGAEIDRIFITDIYGKLVNVLVRGEEYVYHYTAKFNRSASQVRFGMLIKTMSGFELGGAASHAENEAIASIDAGTIVKVEFKFCCRLLPGVYFLNNGVVGIVDNTEGYIHRCIDAAMFRVQPEENMKATTIVDFQIEPTVSVMNQVELA